jgi:hypothetical protein
MYVLLREAAAQFPGLAGALISPSDVPLPSRNTRDALQPARSDANFVPSD